MKLPHYFITINLVYITIVLMLVLSHYDLSASLRRMKKLFDVKYAELDAMRQKELKWQSMQTRDFIRHDCQNMKRVGGFKEFQMNAPHPLYRIDGAW